MGGSAADHPTSRRETSAVRRTHVAVLGPLQVYDGHGRLDVGPPQRRTVLAVLLCGVRQVIPVSRILDCVWGDHPGPSAIGSLHSHISRLRKTLGHGAIIRYCHGYALCIQPRQFDAELFSQLAHRGRSLVEAGRLREGRQRIREALAVWRGRPFEEFEDCSWARREIVRLDAEHLGALVSRLDADLEIGDTDVVGELQALVLEHPKHEGLCAQLMLALYRDGRQSEALTVYRLHANRLVETSGLRPSPPLQALQMRILQHDPSLADRPRSRHKGATMSGVRESGVR